MRFVRLADTSVQLSATTSRRSKVAIAAELLSELDGSPDAVVVLSMLAGKLRQRRTGIGYATAHQVPPAAGDATLTVAAVDIAFEAAAAAAGPGANVERARLWSGLLAAATEVEQRLLVGLVTGDVRQGAAAGVLIEAVAAAGGVSAPDLRRAVTRGGDLITVSAAVLLGGEASLATFDATPGVGLAPMLAGSSPDMAGALARTGPAHVDWKLDGVRAQAHVLPGTDGLHARVFTRSLDDITERVPGVVAGLVALGVPAILDGELLVLGAAAGPVPFQETASRVARQSAGGDVTYVAFDVVYLDGEDFLDRPLTDRRDALDRLVPAGLLSATDPDLPGAVVTVPMLRCPGGTADTERARAFADDALSRGHEGVVVKAADSTYASGRRGSAWVKVKPHETLDLVVLAVEWGSGRRTGWLSNLHLGARDPEGEYGPPGGFVMLGKTFKGLTDQMLAWQTEALLALAVDRGDWQVRVSPELVVEIAFDGVQTSTRYPAGMALRFARVVRHRSDKPAAQADTVAAVRAVHQRAPAA